MNIHEAVLLPLMIKEIFNIQISACQVINKEQARRNMEMGLRKIWESQPAHHRQRKISQTRSADNPIEMVQNWGKYIYNSMVQYFISCFVF